jgi:hypothetical protein
MGRLDRAQWRKSSYSGSNGGNCVEVARNPGGIIAVRDSKDPRGGSARPGTHRQSRRLAGVRCRGERRPVRPILTLVPTES